MARRAGRSLSRWCCYTDPSYLLPRHIRQLHSTLEQVERGSLTRVILTMPPRHGKSETTSKKFPAYYLGRHPDKRAILAAHTASLAETFSRAARALVLEHGPEVFRIELAEDSQAVQQWSIAGRRGGLVAAGVGGPLTGQGADLLIIDDPVKDREAAFSETQRESLWEWYRTVARTRLHPGGAVLLVMTRWHQDDLAGRLLAEAEAGTGERWTLVSMPMLDDEGSILWEARYSAEEVANIRKAVGTYAWESLYQQRPAAPTGNIFRRDWWKTYALGRVVPHPSVSRLLDLEKLQWIMQSWDCAFKGTDDSDFVVGQVWGGIGADRFLLEQQRGRMTFTETLSAMKDADVRWRQRLPRHALHRKLVEDKANGPAVIDTLSKEIPGLVAVNPSGGKESRARAVSPQVESGNVYLPWDGGAWRGEECSREEFISEHASFPTSKNDDQVDATSQLLLRSSLDSIPADRTAGLASW